VAEKKRLIELIDATRLDIHGRVKLIQSVFAINLAAPRAAQALEQMRQEIYRHM